MNPTSRPLALKRGRFVPGTRETPRDPEEIPPGAVVVGGSADKTSAGTLNRPAEARSMQKNEAPAVGFERAELPLMSTRSSDAPPDHVICKSVFRATSAIAS